MRQETSRVTALAALASVCVTELLLPWPVHSDAALIRAVLMMRRPALVAVAASIAFACGALAATTLALGLRPLMLRMFAEPFEALGEAATVWLGRHGAGFAAIAAASPRAPTQAVVLLAALGSTLQVRLCTALLAGRLLKWMVVAHCTLMEPAWLKSLGLGDALTLARCGGAKTGTLLPT